MAMKRKLASALLTAGLVAGAGTTLAPVHVSAASYAAADNFKIIVEDKEISFDPAPFLIDNHTFVPLRSLSEGLGADVQYDGNTNIATITKEDIVLTLNFNTGEVKKNGALMQVNPAPRFVNYRTMVPVRFISEAFGNEVQWEPSTKLVNVLPTSKALAQRQVLRDILSKSAAATNTKSSCAINMKLSGEVPSSYGNMSFDGDLVTEMLQKSLDMHAHGSVTTNVLLQKQTTPLDMYVIGGVTYVMNPTSQAWQKDASGQDQFLKMVEMSAKLPGGGNTGTDNPLLPYAKLTESSTSYTVSYKLDKQGLTKLSQAAPSGNQPSDMQLKQMSDSFSGLTMSYDIDKTTFLQDNVKLSMDMAIPKMGKVTMNVDGKMTYDTVTSIVLPDEAKNAPEAKLTTK